MRLLCGSIWPIQSEKECSVKRFWHDTLRVKFLQFVCIPLWFYHTCDCGCLGKPRSVVLIPAPAGGTFRKTENITTGPLEGVIQDFQ